MTRSLVALFALMLFWRGVAAGQPSFEASAVKLNKSGDQKVSGDFSKRRRIRTCCWGMEARWRLMERMYRIRQSKPQLGKSEALRQAQEQMAGGALSLEARGAGDRGGFQAAQRTKASEGWSHPYYRAPFILIGNWK
jgi:hypothetical protein